MISRRQVLSLPLLAPGMSWAQGRKLNVLFIAVDDLNNRMGCYGDPVVKTPHIDRLASRGVRFDHSYCQYPLCNPSRTSLLSGRRPDTTKILDNRTPPRTTLGNVVFLPEHFRANGYFTARVGKIAHGAFEDAVTWDISEYAQRGAAAKAQRKKAQARGNEEGLKLTWVATDNKDEDEPDGRTARRIAQLMEQGKGKPFFLGAGFHKPHLPWVAPKKYFDMYPPEKIQLPNTPPDDRDDIPPIALTRTQGDETMTELDKKKAVAAYHACTTFMDAQVGVLLGALDRLKLWDNTVVVLFGDHGWHLNDHLGLWRKMTVFEEAARAPLIVAAPDPKGAPQAGVGCPRLVEFVDIYPTLTELCGLPAPQGLEGTSFVPLLSNPQRPWKKAAFTVVKHGGVLGRSVRTDRYRYTEWGSESVTELYDHETDVHEWKNLAFQRPQQPKVQEEMKRVLHAGWKAALP
ncbi:MAG: sulfatase [Acidobacteria bacterium]|nr:sulfatase [Acidobacteriota bacterium]